MSKSEATTPQPWAIDPALQQIPNTTAAGQPTQAFYSYPYYSYQQPHQAQAPAPAQTPRSSTPAAAATSQKGTGGLDTSDINTLSDAIGAAGIDLRAEEESLQKSHDTTLSYRTYQDRTHTQPTTLSFNSHFLGTTVRAIAADTHKLSKPISDDTVNYLALALRSRLSDLIKAMIAASHHRTDTGYDRPTAMYEGEEAAMWDVVVRRDVAKQLAVLERIEKEDELKTRRDRKERADMAAAQLAALQASSGSAAAESYAGDVDMDSLDGENPKKKRKKDGPGVTAKNMSEDVRKQMSNLVANQASGGKKYSWMTASNANVAPRAKTEAGKTTTGAASSPVAAPQKSSWSKPYVSATNKGKETAQQEGVELVDEDTRTKVTLRDAMFVMEKERGHGGGRGAALGWT